MWISWTNLMSVSIPNIILMFLEITAGTVTLTTLFVVMMKAMMKEEFDM